MEIPDLNFKELKPKPQNVQQESFYTVKAIQNNSEDQHCLKQPPYEINFKPIIQDLILKKTMNISWQERYFCLTANRIIYYSSADKSQVKGCFNLASLSKFLLLLQVREEQKILKLLVHVHDDSKNKQKQIKQILVLNFQIIPHRFNAWKDQINKLIRIFSINSPKKMRAPKIQAQNIIHTQQKINGDNYWNKIFLSMEELTEFSQQLDIVFFRSKKPIAAFHRLLMRSNFDHVGLLLKDSNNKTLVLEAIQSRGVWINDWDQMVPIFKQHYEQIAYRKLILNQKNKIDIKKLQIYLDSIIGKKYQLSLSKLIVGENQSTSEDFQQNKKNQNYKQKKITSQKRISIGGNKEKTYFCSQLIADIYIKLGLLKGKKNQFWPKDFQQDLKLQNNAILGPLMYLAL